MATKSAQEKLKKYSGVAENVQKTNNNSVKKEVNKTPEEPRITKEQVVAAFNSFGFQPNERNQNDIGYWTTRPQSEGPKLMEELRKRRLEENGKEDMDKDSKATLPRLSDNDIAALFDEYGFPTPDPEWARNTLPNDPQKIRSILDVQRKNADEMIKQKTTPAPAPVPGQAQSAPMPMMDGMGGPVNGPIGGNGEMMSKPFFIGDHSIVRLSNPNNPNAATTWLVDSKKKVLRPFMSEKAFKNAFEDAMEAEKAIVTISSRELGPGGALAGFKPLQSKDGIRDDGSMDDIEFSPAQIQKRYGKQSDPTAENKALSVLDGVFGNLNTK